jgi:hypothetical protein
MDCVVLPIKCGLYSEFWEKSDCSNRDYTSLCEKGACTVYEVAYSFLSF